VSKQIEIDLVVRIGNNVGLVEAKTWVNKAGIDQLDTAGNSVYLGKHATKFLVTSRYLPRAHKTLASSQHTHVVELPGYTVGIGCLIKKSAARYSPASRHGGDGRLGGCWTARQPLGLWLASESGVGQKSQNSSFFHSQESHLLYHQAD
jgi:hypothetical protein